MSYDPAWPYEHYYHGLNGSSATDHLNRLMYVDLKTWLADAYMEKADKATMACGLEARLPLLDHRLVELAFQIPGRCKIRGRSTKRIFKRAVRRPSATCCAPQAEARFCGSDRSHGFAAQLKNFTFEVLLDDRTRRRGYFDTAVVERLWREHVNGRHVRSSQLWLLLNFELWHRIYLDGEAP